VAERRLKVQLRTQELEDLSVPFFIATAAATTSVTCNMFSARRGQPYTATPVAVPTLNLINSTGHYTVFKTSCLLVNGSPII
jgi:hypothetical protein